MNIGKKIIGLLMIFFAGCQIMAQTTQQVSKKPTRSGRQSVQFGHKGEAPATQTIADVILATPNLKTFAGLLKKHNVLQELQGKGPFTIFAPIDEAFNEDVMYTLNNLSDQEVTHILKHHIVKGIYPADKFKKVYSQATIYELPGVTTLAGDTLDNEGFSSLEQADKTKNGIVYTINSVLIPFQSFK